MKSDVNPRMHQPRVSINLHPILLVSIYLRAEFALQQTSSDIYKGSVLAVFNLLHLPHVTIPNSSPTNGAEKH